MAEVATGAGIALAAEEVVSTGVQAGLAGYMVAKPTMPLKATYSMIAHAHDDASRRSLARSNHSLTVIANKAYVFGGDTAHDGIASNDIHVITLKPSGKPESDYHLIPALPIAGCEAVPEPRTKHSACQFNGRIAIYGGCADNGQLIDERSSIWLFDPDQTAWEKLDISKSASSPGPRQDAKLFSYGDSLILYGGHDASGGSSSDVWRLDTDAKVWSQLPTAPVSTSNTTFANSHLYLISGSDPMSSDLHFLNISAQDESSTWQKYSFPTNPIAPGPRARHCGGLLPTTTGYGRNYLVYFLGEREKPLVSNPSTEDKSHNVTQWSDIWTLQLPSSDLDAKPRLNVGEAIKPAKIKDSIRSALGAGSGEHTWAEAEVQLPTELQLPDGKLHPGPRGNFGCDVMPDGNTVVLWGGEDAKGDRVGDGWLIELK